MTESSRSEAESTAKPGDPSSIVQWSSLIGHDHVQRWFSSAIQSGRLGGSFLLIGLPGVGKRTVARLLTQTVFCEKSNPAKMDPCGNCSSCLQVLAGTHPDLVRVGKPKDKSFIPLELLIGPPNARMQEGFCRDLRLRPMLGNRKVAIVEDADFLNEEGANCLLKTLEEPPAGAVILVIGTSEQRQLPTIRSRCQIVRLGPLNAADAGRLLRQAHNIVADQDRISEAVEISGGDMHVAARLLSEETDEFRTAFSGQLSSDNPDPTRVARLINDQVEQVGKDATKRRSAMRDIFSMSVQHYRRQLRQEALGSTTSTSTINRLDRSIRALREIDRNANQSTLIECYAADIALATTGDRGEIG
jgi:DNA polymerase-3 subunit delta'